MATLPIELEVEAEALGPVLIKLRTMPGIIKIHLDLLHGSKQAAAPGEPRARGNNAERILAMLIAAKGEPITLADFAAQMRVPKSSLYTSFSQLKKQGVLKSGGVGKYMLSAKGMEDLLGYGPKLLPKPDVAKTPSGRQPSGHGRAILLAVLASTPGTRGDVAKAMSAQGIGENSVGGLFDRAKRDSLIRKVGNNWELTAAGQKAAQSQEK